MKAKIKSKPIQQQNSIKSNFAYPNLEKNNNNKRRRRRRRRRRKIRKKKKKEEKNVSMLVPTI